jgi:hypothetical protein
MSTREVSESTRVRRYQQCIGALAGNGKSVQHSKAVLSSVESSIAGYPAEKSQLYRLSGLVSAREGKSGAENTGERKQ